MSSVMKFSFTQPARSRATQRRRRLPRRPRGRPGLRPRSGAREAPSRARRPPARAPGARGRGAAPGPRRRQEERGRSQALWGSGARGAQGSAPLPSAVRPAAAGVRRAGAVDERHRDQPRFDLVPQGPHQGPPAREHPPERPRNLQRRGLPPRDPAGRPQRGRARRAASKTCTCSASAARRASPTRVLGERRGASSRSAASASARTRSTSHGANRRGVPVFNAPFSNTRSVAELIIAEVVMLARRLGDRVARDARGPVAQGRRPAASRCAGRRSASSGYGHIGRQVGVLAEAMGMRVAFFDIAAQAADGQ